MVWTCANAMHSVGLNVSYLMLQKISSRERWSEGGRREGSPSLLFLNSPILPQFYPPSTKILVLVLEGVEDDFN